MTYPEIKWAQLTMRNPDRRWWQFWKPKRVLMGDRLIDVLNQPNALLQDVVWVDTRIPPTHPVPTLTGKVEPKPDTQTINPRTPEFALIRHALLQQLFNEEKTND